jgi:zinc transport system permease protein
MEMFHIGFMQRAFIVGGCIALIAPLIGLLLLLRRQSLFADTLSHVSVAGVAIGAMLGWHPSIGATVIAVCGAMFMERLRRSYRAYSELSVAIVMTTGLSLALVLMSLQSGLHIRFQSYLFGSIVSVRTVDVWWIVTVCTGVLLFMGCFYRQLYCMTFDEDTAMVGGVRVHRLSMAFSLLAGLTVSVMMPLIGVLLVSAVVIVPAALAMRIVHGFVQTLIAAACISVMAMGSGLTISYTVGTPPGATIALLLVCMLLCGLAIRSGVRRIRIVAARRADRDMRTHRAQSPRQK